MDNNQPERNEQEREYVQGALYAIEQLVELVVENGQNGDDNERHERLRLDGHRPEYRMDEYRELMAARFLAHQFARRIRVVVNELQEERNLMRQEVINRGLIDPNVYFRQGFNHRNGWDQDPGRPLKYAVHNPSAPSCLTNIAVSAVVNGVPLRNLTALMDVLPLELVYSIHKEMYVKRMFDEIGDLWCQPAVFDKLLMYKNKRIELHKMYEEVKNSVSTSIPSRLIRGAKRKATTLSLSRRKNGNQLKQLYDFMLELGNFFLECLTYSWAGEAFQLCRRIFRDLSLSPDERKNEKDKLMYYLLIYYTGSCDFENAKEMSTYFDTTFADARQQDFKVEDGIDYGQVLIQCAVLWQQMGCYKKAVGYVVDALKTVAYRKTSLRTMVNVFRLSAKILISVRQLNLGSRLIKHAVHTAFFSHDSYRRFPHVLLDYAFCLINLDYIKQAVSVYADAIEFLEDIFGNFSVCLSQAYEEMAYALYVLEYSTGDFFRASDYAEKAVSLNKLYLPNNHMLIATSRRMKALIMEEQALGERDELRRREMLQEALQLHTDALLYYQCKFGDENIFTAKNFGNLGRLYQSLRDFKKSEEMHLKAIEIKKRVVGEDDYETALSLGHLAALYTNDMGRHTEAKDLYLRSAEIVTKIFGDTFTGLQYDYRGLHRVYTELGEEELAQQCYLKLIDWYEKRRVKRAGAFLRIWSDIPYEKVKDASELAREVLEELALAGYV